MHGWPESLAKVEAARAATSLSPIEGQILSIVFYRQFCAPTMLATRALIDELLSNLSRNTVPRAIKGLLDRRILVASDENLRKARFSINLALSEWVDSGFERFERVLTGLRAPVVVQANEAALPEVPDALEEAQSALPRVQNVEAKVPHALPEAQNAASNERDASDDVQPAPPKVPPIEPAPAVVQNAPESAQPDQRERNLERLRAAEERQRQARQSVAAAERSQLSIELASILENLPQEPASLAKKRAQEAGWDARAIGAIHLLALHQWQVDQLPLEALRALALAFRTHPQPQA